MHLRGQGEKGEGEGGEGGAGIRAAYEERDGREDIRLSELVASDLLRERGLSERE